MLSGDNMDVRPQSALSAFGTIELVSDFGNADSGVGSEVLISGSLSAGSVSVAAARTTTHLSSMTTAFRRGEQ